MLQQFAETLHVNPTTLYTIFVAGLLVAALAVGFILNRILHHWTKKFRNTWGELVFALLESLPLPLLVLASLYTSLALLTLPWKYERIGSKLIFALLILVLFYFPAKVTILFLRRMGQKKPGLDQVAQPAAFVIRALFALLAVIIVLENLGISLTAVWTTLGVGSVAVALALQDTLTNFFAGLYLLMGRPISPGDYIKLETGQEGFVVRTGGRSTSLRTLTNNIVVVPNSTLAKAVITNYSAPEPRMAVAISVGVAYGTDARRVEKILAEIAEQAAREGLEGLLLDPPPVARLIPGFGASSLDFTLAAQVREFRDQFPVQAELRKRILERFQKEGIEIPFPTQAILLNPPAAGSREGEGPEA